MWALFLPAERIYMNRLIEKNNSVKQNFSVNLKHIKIECVYWNDFPYISAALIFPEFFQGKTISEILETSVLRAVESCFNQALQNQVFRLFLLVPASNKENLNLLKNTISNLSSHISGCDVFLEIFLEACSPPSQIFEYPGMQFYSKDQNLLIFSISLDRKKQAQLLDLVESGW